MIFKGKSKNKDALVGREESFGWTADEQARWEKGQQTDHFRSLWKESKKNKKSRETELQELAMDVARAREVAARKGRLASPQPLQANAEAVAATPVGVMAQAETAQTSPLPPPAPTLSAATQNAAQPASGAPSELSLGERLRLKMEAIEAAKAGDAPVAIEREPAQARPQKAVSPQTAPIAAQPALSAPDSLSASQAKEELFEQLLADGYRAQGRDGALGVLAPASGALGLGEPKAVALFDFDGTLTNPGTIGLFFIAAAGPFKVLMRAHDLIEDRRALKAGSMSFEETLAHAGEWFLGDLSEEQMRAAGARVLRWLRWMPRGWNKKTVARLESLKKLGAHVELISGSFPWVAQEAASEWEVGCLCSEWAQTEDGWSLKKAMVETAKGERVDELRAQWPSATILAFGNSFGDKQMLMKADEAWFVAGKNKAPAKINRTAVAALQP